MKLAQEEGFKETTLAKARKELGVKCFPEFDDDGNKCWHWRLPKKEGEKPKIPGLAEAQARGLAQLKKMKESMGLS